MVVVAAGDLLMRVTISMSVAAYAAAEYLWYRRRVEAFRLRRILWTGAAALCLLHSGLAFHVQHGWSHDAAVRQTAAQTAAVTGIDWGGGVFVNYAFLGLWAADVAWLWAAPASYLRRPPVVNGLVSAFFLFIIVNGAVVFAGGPARIVGIAATATVIRAWWSRRQPVNGGPAA
jgi:hypothetical protein